MNLIGLKQRMEISRSVLIGGKSIGGLRCTSTTGNKAVDINILKIQLKRLSNKQDQGTIKK